MNSVIKYSLISIILVSGGRTYAQVVDLRLVDPENQNLFFSELRSLNINGISYDDIKGSPYYSEDFISGEIYFSNQRIVKGVSLRLNLYKHTIEFQRDAEILEMTRMEEFDYVNLNGEKIILLKETAVTEDAGFYKVILDGKYQLLEFLQVQYFDPVEAKSFYEDDAPAEFKRIKEKYYLRSGDKDPLAFGNKRNFKKVFSDVYPELVKFASDNKLNPTDADDLVEMVNCLNAR